MLTYKKIFEDEKIVKYEYYPEGKQGTGIVGYDKKEKDVFIEKQAANDKVGWYKMHILAELDDFAKTGVFKETGMVAWY